MSLLGLYFNLHTNGNCWKYTLDIGKLRICWKPVKIGRQYIKWQYA